MQMQLRFTTLYTLLLLLLPLQGWAQEDSLGITQALELLQQAEQRGEG